MPPAGTAVPRVLPGARTGSDLVPGEPQRVNDLADQLEAMARGLRAVDRLLHGAGLPGWRGATASAAALTLQATPLPYARAARAVAAAALAVRAHASALTCAQRDADEAVALDLRAVAHGAASAAPLQQQAMTIVEHARASVRGSAGLAADAMRTAALAAPDRPNALVRLVRRVLDVQREVQLGIVESLVTSQSALMPFSLVRAAIDPAGWSMDLSAIQPAMRQSASRVAHHPLAWARRSVTDAVQGAAENPARAIGHLAPDVALGVATGAAATVAGRGASLSVRATSTAARGAAGTRLRGAVQVSGSTTRSRLRLRDLRPYAAPADRTGGVSRLAPEQHLVVAAVARDARWAAADLTPRVEAAALRSGVRRVGHDHVVKTRASLYRKLSGPLAEPGAALRPVIAEVNDTVRYTLVAPDDRYVAAVATVVASLRGQGLQLVRGRDFWPSPRYRGLNLTLADARTGRLVEVQVHTPSSWAATQGTHRDYERMRVTGLDPAERALLSERIGREYAQVPTPAGITGLAAAIGPAEAPTATLTTPRLLSVHPLAPPTATAGAVGLQSLTSRDGACRRP